MALYEAVLQTQHKDEIITLTLIYQMKFNATLANINKDAADLGKNNLSNNTDIITTSIKCISSPVWFDEQLSRNYIFATAKLKQASFDFDNGQFFESKLNSKNLN